APEHVKNKQGTSAFPRPRAKCDLPRPPRGRNRVRRMRPRRRGRCTPPPRSQVDTHAQPATIFPQTERALSSAIGEVSMRSIRLGAVLAAVLLLAASAGEASA